MLGDGRRETHELRTGCLDVKTLRRGEELSDPADVRQLAQLLKLNRVVARRSLGQNFLVNATLRDRVIGAARLGPEDEVLEIGPGAGSLTAGLAERCRRLVAVELDSRLASGLRRQLEPMRNVEVLNQDILKTDFEQLFPEGGHVVVGNIPFYLTGALMPKLLERPPRPRRINLVVQREVAERWTTPGHGSLSTVAINTFAEPELLFVLPADAFEPQPKVDSALVRMEVREQPAVEVADLGAFFRFVEGTFQFRRKQLKAGLGRMTGLGSTAAAERLSTIDVDPSRRPQTLSLKEWEAVYQRFID
jgi:16S rRNA (adenine1518-N6/adenine1519-N6)-dimethyltransferase